MKDKWGVKNYEIFGIINEVRYCRRMVSWYFFDWKVKINIQVQGTYFGRLSLVKRLNETIAIYIRQSLFTLTQQRYIWDSFNINNNKLIKHKKYDTYK